jgi:phosphatidylserine decarboxylase
MAKEGLPFLVVTGLISVLSFTLFSASGLGALAYLGGVAGVCFLALCCFFRDPERVIPTGEGVVVSAADGRVVDIREVGDGIQVSVFLSIFDVHVNRIPFSGRVMGVQSRPGRFRFAFSRHASAENEQVAVEIEHDGRRLVVKQIAGFVARRIVCRVTEGEQVRRGERFGMIKFGSRVDLILPVGSEVRVRVGDRARAGETIMGVMKT